MSKIVYLPLDERPCNYDFPLELFADCGVEIVSPPRIILSSLKKPANSDEVLEFLTEQCKTADGLVISIDMLLYGGLVSSRIHYLTNEEVGKRMSVLKKLKTINPDLKIYAFQLVMRCTNANSNFEEPDYYKYSGVEINKYGVMLDKLHRGKIQKDTALAELEKLKANITEENLSDYMARRAFNFERNIDILQHLSEGYIDFLAVPQDDSARYGFTILDQNKLRKEMLKRKVGHKVLSYPGADELGMVLMSKMFQSLKGTKLRFFLSYASVEGKFVIPLYEDLPLGETIKYQISAAGGVIVSDEESADIILLINIAGGEMQEAFMQFNEKNDYFRRRNLPSLIEQANYWQERGKTIAIADLAFANGGDIELLDLLNQRELLFKIHAIAGWNTSSNSLGNTIAMACATEIGKKQLRPLLLKRYIEDFGYCSIIRRALPEIALKFNESIREIPKESLMLEVLKEKIYDFTNEYLNLGKSDFDIENLYFPWNRTFEIGFDIKLKF